MTAVGLRRASLLLVGLVVLLAAGPLLAAPLTGTGRKAYDTARAAEDRVNAALEEGEKTVERIKALAPESTSVPEALKSLLGESEAATQALVSFRRLALTSATDALRLLADVAKLPNVPAGDLVRRDTLEQHALLAAHEAAVMAARARTETERLRAILAEARLATAEGRSAGRAARAPSTNRGGAESPAPESPRPGDAVVPNLIGLRLETALRDLEAAGLKLGPVTGPREGHVIKQSPDGGTAVARQSPVSLTLSATAATMSPPQ